MKKTITILTILFTLLTAQAFAETSVKKPAKLRYSLDFLIEKTLELKKLEKREDIALPKFFFQSKTPLKQFQDAVEKQWGFRPDVFTNAFAVDNNEVYILDDAAYYERHGRCMDDSVVHELVHYLQVKYQNWDLSDESLEWDAIEKQTEFRTQYCPVKN